MTDNSRHLGSAALRASSFTNALASSSGNNSDRLRRLRTEADYYGLHQLVHDIDVVTVGEKIIFEDCGWARVAGGCLPRNHQPGVINENNNEDNNNQNGNAEGAAAQNNGNDQAVDGNGNDQNENDEDQEMNENDDDEEEAEEEEEEQVFDDDDEDEEEGDPNQPLAYKHWSWSQQYGNPNILRPHPTHTSSMIVGEDGSYLLLLRLAAALPSPLARIKWDQEEEEGRRVTRGARRRRRGNLDDNDDDPDTSEDDNDSPGRSKDLEEDYFVTVNIEAPLQTVMDSVDESQTHFPLLRTGLWDYRPEEEVLNEDPVFATFCAMDVVSLRAGDILSVSFMNDEVSRERSPFPDNTPPELVNSLTLVKIYGNTLARYERLKSSPDLEQRLLSGRRSFSDNKGMMAGGLASGMLTSSPARKTPAHRRGSSRKHPPADHNMDEESIDDDHHQSQQSQMSYQSYKSNASNQYDCEAEEFDRSLTRTAHWISPRNDFLPTPFQPPLNSNSSTIEFPHPGHYLLLGRVALGCRRDAKFNSVLSGGPIEGHRAQLSVRSAGGRLLHALGFVFEDKPRLEWADLSILSENAMFNDVVHVPQAGTELSITTTGDCRLHPEGTDVGPFCTAVSQSLSCLLLDDDMMEG